MIKQQRATFVDWCYCLREVLFQCVCCLQVCLVWKTISCHTDKENRVKYSQIWQGTCEENVSIRILSMMCPYICLQVQQEDGATS